MTQEIEGADEQPTVEFGGDLSVSTVSHRTSQEDMLRQDPSHSNSMLNVFVVEEVSKPGGIFVDKVHVLESCSADFRMTRTGITQKGTLA